MDDRYFDLANYELAKSQRALISAKRAFDEGDYIFPLDKIAGL